MIAPPINAYVACALDVLSLIFPAGLSATAALCSLGPPYAKTKHSTKDLTYCTGVFVTMTIHLGKLQACDGDG